MPKLEIVDAGVVYRNPQPGYQYNFACHSHVTVISATELLCAFQRGQALYSVDSVCVRSRSKDGGKTWVEEGEIFDQSGDDRPYSYHGPYVTRLPDGVLVAIACRMDRSDPAAPLFNEKTAGMVQADTVLVRSADHGVTWSKLEVLNLPKYVTPTSPIVVLKDGRWFASFDQWHAYEAPGPYRPRTVGLFSNDGGRSWRDAVQFADGGALGKGYWHGRMVRLRDDRLFTLFWTGAMNPPGSLPLHACFGSTDGRDWIMPVPTNIPGQTNWPVDFGQGRMVAIYTVREGNEPGFYVTSSTDGGITWDLEKQLKVWDAAGRDKIGVHSLDAYPRSHDTIAFGAPTAVQLPDGDVFFSFWCTEMSVTQIRYARVRVK